jgi:hypothetical protein
MLTELNHQSYEITKQENQKIYNELKLLSTSNEIERCIANAISKDIHLVCIFSKNYDSRINYDKLLKTSIDNSVPILDSLKQKYPEPEFRIAFGSEHIYSRSLDKYCRYYTINIRWGTNTDDCQCIII